MPDYTTDDLPIEPPESNGDWEQIPTGAYLGKLVAFRVQDKPDWKVNSELLRKPEKEPDRSQWEWTFEITEGEFVGLTISDWTNRSWHERSKAAAHACALLDVTVLPRGQGFTTGKLVGRPCQVWVVSKENASGQERSYVDKVLPLPKRRGASAPGAAQAPVQPQQQAAPTAVASDTPHTFQGPQMTGPCDVCNQGAGHIVHALQGPASQMPLADAPELSEADWQRLADEAEATLSR